jgi:putative FmdB family regulatory protein
MPTYTYRCTKCDAEYEVVQSMSDPPLKRCKKCRGALRRTFHPVGIVLKGSGFHRTDYRSKPRPGEPGEPGAKGEKKSSEEKTESKSESKTETKKDTKTSDTKKSDSGS